MCSQLGLPSLSDTFLSNLVDGRVLHSLTKEDLKRHLKITRKLEQVNLFPCALDHVLSPPSHVSYVWLLISVST